MEHTPTWLVNSFIYLSAAVIAVPLSQPFDLPQGWEWVRLDTIFRTITDGDHLPPPVSDVGIAFLTIGIRPLRNFFAPLPPLAEQSRVASLRTLCADLRQRLSAARAQQALLAGVLVDAGVH